MLPDLQHLIQLQEIESTADRLRRRIEDIPAAQEALQARLDAAKGAVDAVQARIAANQALKRDIDKDLAAAQGRLSKYRDQLMAVKTNKEYQAMQHEIAAAEGVVRGLEDRELDRMEEADGLTAQLKAAEAALKNDQADVTRDQQGLGKERGDLLAELQALEARRAEVARQVSASAMSIFERLAQSRKGLALAEARDGLCTVCRVRLRPQVFNEVRRNDSLIQCDSCGRILYFVPAAPGAAAQSS